jgi:hypothetical protein
MSARIHVARLICLFALTVAAGLPAATAAASKSQETIFEDDTLLVTKPPDTVRRTLDTMRSLGADRVRVLLFWNQLAFDAGSRTSPTPDDSRADNPESYSPAGWAQYDLIVREAEARGIKVDLNLAPPAPLWATLLTDDPELQDHYKPIPSWFRHFAAAVGKRYSGSYTPQGATRPLPRVIFWSLWNEPNEWHFLAPQYATPRSPVERAASLYRDLLDAGYAGLSQSGHGGDIILIGETAPKGRNDPGSHHSLKPLRFIRALYCVDRKFMPLQGTAAQNLVCPTTSTGRASFAGDHPGLFQTTGWAHHPYALATKPGSVSRDPDDLALGDLPRLSSTLRSVFRAHGRGSAGLPVYLTEFGFQTSPPDPFGLAPSRQADFLNQSEFAVYGNSRVRSYAQFLLVDDGPDTRFSPSSFFYWNNFQTGLVWGAGSGLEGRVKPALGAFRIPIFVPVTKSRRAATFRVWGAVRPAPNGTFQAASIQFKGRSGPFKQIKLATTTNFRGYVDVKVRITQSGQLRIAWTDPSGTTLFSRNVGVKIGR